MPTPSSAPTAAAGSGSLVRNVFSHGAIYAFAGVLSQGIAFLLFPFFTHVFGPSDYGVIDLLGVLATLVTLTVALEIAQGLGRHFVEADADGRVAYASTALWFSLAAYTLTLGVGLLLAEPLTAIVLGEDVDPGVMRVGLCTIWCAGMLYLLQNLLRWDLRPGAFATVSVTAAGVVTASSAVYVLVFDWGVTGAIAGQMTGYAIAGLLAFALAHRHLAFRFDRRRWHEMIAYSLPLVPASIGVFLNGYADRIAIQSRLTLFDVGLYGVAYRLSLIVGLTLIGFQGALVPLVVSRHQEPATRVDLARVFRLFAALALSVWLLISVFADELLRLLTRPAYYEAADIVPVVVAAAFCAGMYVFAPGMVIAKRTRVLGVVTATAGAANLALAFVLVVPLGILGAAIAFLVTAAAGFVALMWVSQRLYRVPHEWSRLLLALALTSALVVLGALLPPVDGVAPALIKVGIATGGVALAAALLVGRDERAHARTLLRSVTIRRSRRTGT